MNAIRNLIDQASSAFSRLSPRERNLVAMTIGLVLLFAVGMTSFAVSKSISKRDARIRLKMSQLEEVSKLTAGYRQHEQERTDLEGRLRSNQVRLFSYLDDLAKKQGIELGGLNDKGSQPVGGDGSKITEASVEVNFTRISLDKLVRFLSEVESQGLVKVTRLQVRPRSDEPVIDAWLVISTYQLS